MYGLIGKIETIPGQRDALAAILLKEDADALWVTEVWDSRDSHAASLALPSVQNAIREGRPLIAGFSQRTETSVLGGHGLD